MVQKKILIFYTILRIKICSPFNYSFRVLKNCSSLCQVIRNHCCTLKKLKGGYAFVCINDNYYVVYCKQWILIYVKTVSKSNCDILMDKNNLVISAAHSLWLKYKIFWMNMFWFLTTVLLEIILCIQTLSQE